MLKASQYLLMTLIAADISIFLSGPCFSEIRDNYFIDPTILEARDLMGMAAVLGDSKENILGNLETFNAAYERIDEFDRKDAYDAAVQEVLKSNEDFQENTKAFVFKISSFPVFFAGYDFDNYKLSFAGPIEFRIESESDIYDYDKMPEPKSYFYARGGSVDFKLKRKGNSLEPNEPSLTKFCDYSAEDLAIVKKVSSNSVKEGCYNIKVNEKYARAIRDISKDSQLYMSIICVDPTIAPTASSSVAIGHFKCEISQLEIHTDKLRNVLSLTLENNEYQQNSDLTP